MKKIFVAIFFISISHQALGYEIEEYVEKLEWQNKWNRVTNSAIGAYVERGKSAYPAGLNEKQTAQVSQKIYEALHNRLGWESMSQGIISSFRTECGDELLDQMVDYYSGVQYSQEDISVIGNAYTICAQETMKEAMGRVQEEIEYFSETEKSILQKITEK